MSDKKEMPHFTLEVVKWEGRLHCCYLNSFRIAGSKPWAGGETVKSWPVPLRDLVRAIPELRKMEEDRDTALSQLAALREELASVNRSFDELAEIVGFSEDRLSQTGDSPMDCATQLQQRLADAGRRNAELIDLLREMRRLPQKRCAAFIVEIIDLLYSPRAALNKPEEAKKCCEKFPKCVCYEGADGL